MLDRIAEVHVHECRIITILSGKRSRVTSRCVLEDVSLTPLNQLSSRTKRENVHTRKLFFGQHVRDGVLTVMTDGHIQLRPRTTLKRETRFSTVVQHFRDHKVLPSLVCGFLDGPSNCEEPTCPICDARLG